MSKWNMVIDVARCSNCHNCVLASKDELEGNAFAGYTAPLPRHGAEVIRIVSRVRGEGAMVDASHLPLMCNHCDDAPCVKAAPEIINKRKDGIVIIDPQRAEGRSDLLQACPYGAIVWNADAQVPQIWFFDAHLLDAGWTEPRASQACPTGAMKAIRQSDEAMARQVQAEGLEVLSPHLKTSPRVYYRNLGRTRDRFLGGTVCYCDATGELEVCIDATVTLRQGGACLRVQQTNAFGDFRFDGVVDGDYTLSIEHAVRGRLQQPVRIDGRSRYLELLQLGAG